MSSSDQQTIGRLSAEVSGLNRSVDKMEKRFESIEAKIDKLSEPIIKARGGYVALAWLIGAAATAGGLVSKVIDIWQSTPHQ